MIVSSDSPDTSTDEETPKDSLFQIQIAKKDIPQVNAIYSILSIKDEEDPRNIIVLGIDNEVDYDETTGKVQDYFSGTWVTLQGHLVSMYLEEEAEDYLTYNIPVKLNGEKANIRILYDDKNPDGVILGAWSGIDENTQMPDKNIMKINPGDKIIPQYYYYTTYDDTTGYMDGPELTVGKDPEFKDTDLPAADYLYGFYILDYSQNETYSEYIDLTVDENGEFYIND